MTDLFKVANYRGMAASLTVPICQICGGKMRIMMPLERRRNICRVCRPTVILEWARERRRQVVRSLSPASQCRLCGAERKLTLAHRYYAQDSVLPNVTSDTYLRQKEATKHPERFYALCPPCHMAFDRIKRIAGLDLVQVIWKS